MEHVQQPITRVFVHVPNISMVFGMDVYISLDIYPEAVQGPFLTLIRQMVHGLYKEMTGEKDINVHYDFELDEDQASNLSDIV